MRKKNESKRSRDYLRVNRALSCILTTVFPCHENGSLIVSKFAKRPAEPGDCSSRVRANHMRVKQQLTVQDESRLGRDLRHRKHFVELSVHLRSRHVLFAGSHLHRTRLHTPIPRKRERARQPARANGRQFASASHAFYCTTRITVG